MKLLLIAKYGDMIACGEAISESSNSWAMRAFNLSHRCSWRFRSSGICTRQLLIPSRRFETTKIPHHPIIHPCSVISPKKEFVCVLPQLRWKNCGKSRTSSSSLPGASCKQTDHFDFPAVLPNLGIKFATLFKLHVASLSFTCFTFRRFITGKPPV